MADPIFRACPECGHPLARVSSVIRDENRWECEGPVQHRFEDLDERRAVAAPLREIEHEQ